ncbi:MAG: D-alanyl-D-alanine carboxypeptidase [Ruminococcaceae bacterium]|nr:D-alanyl-D-alanine carboxypeptidase [Oscillospiraceae bacterium]
MLKRILSLLLISAVLCGTVIKASAAEALSVSAKSAVLMDGNSKEILYEKNSGERLPMASTTKIMTALVVLESLDLSHTFRVDERAVGTEGTSAYLQKGDTLTVEAALFALLLQSANDVANALAYEVGESIEGFAALMNEKARELGLCDTSFKNPSGLPEEGHCTTARDLAFLGAACLENEDFLNIVSTKSKTVKISDKDRTFVNHNKLLTLYEGAIGVKTGFTKESGRCLVGAAERNGVRLVTVTLSASNDWKCHSAMLDYGFEKYRSYTLYSKNSLLFELPVAGCDSSVTVSPEGEKKITLPYGKKISVKIEAPSLITAPVKKGAALGTAVFYADEKEIWRTPLLAISKVL